jgi:hypothetical protein
MVQELISFESRSGRSNLGRDVLADGCHASCVVSVGVRDHPVTPNKTQVWQKALQLWVLMCRVIMKDPDTVPGTDSLHLTDHTATLEAAVHQLSKRGGIVERPAVDKIFDVSDEETPGEIIFLLDRSGPFEVRLGGIDTECIVRQFLYDETALLRPIQCNRNVRLAPGKRKGAGQRHELKHQIRVIRGKRPKFARQDIIAQAVWGPHSYSPADGRFGADNLLTDPQEFWLRPLGCLEKRLTGGGQRTAVCLAFNELGFDFFLKRCELPPHGRMVESEPSGRTKNLASPCYSEKDTDALPVHDERLQFLHNRSAILVLAVQSARSHSSAKSFGHLRKVPWRGSNIADLMDLKERTMTRSALETQILLRVALVLTMINVGSWLG